MTKLELEVFSPATNAVVARFPGRKFPGVLVQGDTLWSLYRNVLAVQPLIVDPESDAAGSLNDALETLSGLIAHYEETLAEHGIELPYFKAPHVQ